MTKKAMNSDTDKTEDWGAASEEQPQRPSIELRQGMQPQRHGRRRGKSAFQRLQSDVQYLRNDVWMLLDMVQTLVNKNHQ